MLAANGRNQQIDGVEIWNNNNPQACHRKKLGAFQPQRGRDENIPQIEEIEQVLSTILPPIKRRPHQNPNGPQDFSQSGMRIVAIVTANYHGNLLAPNPLSTIDYYELPSVIVLLRTKERLVSSARC